jgi:hypothetical protein
MLGAYFFDHPKTLIFGAVFGMLFGFFLRKAKVTRFNTIVGQMLFKDFTMMKVMMTAIIVGGVGVYFMLQTGMLETLQISPATLSSVLIGGSIFGVGMGILGYCPGTSIAALADGSRDVIFGILGMLTAIASFAEIYPWIKTKITLAAPEAKVTLVEVLGVSPWLIFVALSLFAIGFFAVIAKIKGRPDKQRLSKCYATSSNRRPFQR